MKLNSPYVLTFSSATQQHIPMAFPADITLVDVIRVARATAESTGYPVGVFRYRNLIDTIVPQAYTVAANPTL